MNYKVLFGIELEKTKELEKKLTIRDVEISNLKDDVKNQRKLIKAMQDKIAELEAIEPQIVYLTKGDVIYG
jgi:uncharacterized coiled-coil protein SlyX